MKYTVPLKQNHEFRRLYNKGRSAVSPYFAIYCRRTGRPVNRLGITASVKLGGAVKRNRARRRIRELYRTHEADLAAGYDIVIVARIRVIYGRYPELVRSFGQQMKKLGLKTCVQNPEIPSWTGGKSPANPVSPAVNTGFNPPQRKGKPQ